MGISGREWRTLRRDRTKELRQAEVRKMARVIRLRMKAAAPKLTGRPKRRHKM